MPSAGLALYIILFNLHNVPLRWVLSPFSEEKIEAQRSNLHMVTKLRGEVRL